MPVLAPRQLIIVTLMSPTGDAGVQAHFNLIASAARQSGIDVLVVHPHGGYLRKPLSLITRGMMAICVEWGVRWDRWIAAMLLRRRVRRALSAFPTRAVTLYAQDPLSAGAALSARSGRTNVRVVGVVHYNISEAWEHVTAGIAKENGGLCKGLLDVERCTLPQLDSLVFCSHFTMRTVLARVPELEKERLRVVHHFASLPKLLSPSSKFSGDLISIGTLEPRKNQSFLIRMLAEARQQGFRYTLTLVGRGPAMNEYRTLARGLGVDGAVTFAGRIDGAAALIASHRLYVHSAIAETFGITLVEALASGRPIAAAPVGGIPEIFRDGVEGIYLDVADPVASAKRLIQLLEDDASLQRFGEAALRRYQEAFAPEVLAPRWLDLIIGGWPIGAVGHRPDMSNVGPPNGDVNPVPGS